MDSSDSATPEATLELNGTANRRKSGRVRQKPVLLSKDPNIPQSTVTGGKRKRAETVAENVDVTSDVNEDESSREESDPDEEELKEKRRKASHKKRPPPKSSAKKAKTGPGLKTNLAVRPAVNGVKKAPKPKQARPRPIKNGASEGTGLYAEVFSLDSTFDAISADWTNQWKQNNSEAMCDLVNLVIKCTGCDLQVDVHDINDPDNVVGKLTDLQDEYHDQGITDYPLISRAKGNASFRSILTGFFESFILTCHNSGLLYSDQAIIENIEVWVSTMSSSAIRPFRHTATVISLTIASTLCTVANTLEENAARTRRQRDGEQTKKSVNKERVKSLEATVAEWERKRTLIVESLISITDTVFVHRFRDVEPKIRVDCMAALGNWVITLPGVFFEGIWLRYFGWVLSDTFAPTRAEVIKQLSKMFKNKENVARLRTFTERFRDRLVEMAVRDSEVSIRAATVELLDMIRKTGLLEPNDIDSIGRLVFDSEPRVRKAVAGFFAENINDLFESTVEDLGGEEDLAEILGDEIEDDYNVPRMSWLKLKCITEALQSYEAMEGEDGQAQREVDGTLTMSIDSRYALAAQTIYAGIPEAREWEVISGYLLCDLSTADQGPQEGDAPFRSRCKLNDKEELLMLEILNVAVTSRLQEAVEGAADKKGRLSKAQKEEMKGVQEATALRLSTMIPELLQKFGSDSAAASAVLRLEHVLNLEIFQELRQDSTKYASLLDDINKQFLTHTDQGVLTEASNALLHARGFEDLEEVTETKLSELWEDTIETLKALIVAGILDNVSELCNTVRRIAKLASISDCVEVFDREVRAASKKKSSSGSTASTRTLLLEILTEPAFDAEAGEEADELLMSASRALLFYYMWTVHTLRNTITSNELIIDPPNYSNFAEALTSLIETRHKASSLRLAAIGTLLDLFTLFATFRHIIPSPANADSISTLIQHVSLSAETPILATYTELEKTFAKKARKPLEAADDDDPASEPEDSSDDEDDGDDSQRKETLLAEKRFCELSGKMVLAIVARVLDHDGPSKGKIRTRLQRNKTRLGSNFKEVVAYLDGPPKAKTRKKPAKKAKETKSVEIVDESEEGEPRFEEGGDEDLRERELVDDGIVGPGEENGDEDDGEEQAVAGANEDEDDVMGD